MKTLTQRIQDELASNIDLPAEEVVERLARKGVNVKKQTVWNVRSDIKRGKLQMPVKKKAPADKAMESRLNNTHTLRDHVRMSLKGRNLYMDEIEVACRRQGYKSQESSYRENLRKMLNDMVEKGELVRVFDNSYALVTPITAPEPQPQRSDLENLLAVHNLMMKVGGAEVFRQAHEFAEKVGAENLQEVANLSNNIGADRLKGYIETIKTLSKSK